MPKKSTGPRQGTGFWWLLLFVPIGIATIVLLPQLGQQGEGLFPEWLGTHLAFTESFFPFATDVKRWGGSALALSIVIGVLFWFLTSRGWDERWRSLDMRQVRGYRGFVFRHTVAATLAASALSSGLFLLSASLRTIPVPSWIILASFCAAIAALQHLATIWGITKTRRLFRGK